MIINQDTGRYGEGSRLDLKLGPESSRCQRDSSSHLFVYFFSKVAISPAESPLGLAVRTG